MPQLEHKICAEKDVLEGKSRGFNISGKAIFLVKLNSSIYCYVNECPHLGVELEWTEDEFLDPDGKLIQCHLHGALFTIEEGNCIAGPCSGDKLRSLPIIVQEGFVYLKPDLNIDQLQITQ